MILSDDDTIVVEDDAVSIKNCEELDIVFTNEDTDDEDCSAEVERSNIKDDDADDDVIVYDPITDSEELATVNEEYIDVEGNNTNDDGSEEDSIIVDFCELDTESINDGEVITVEEYSIDVVASIEDVASIDEDRRIDVERSVLCVGEAMISEDDIA